LHLLYPRNSLRGISIRLMTRQGTHMSYLNKPTFDYFCLLREWLGGKGEILSYDYPCSDVVMHWSQGRVKVSISSTFFVPNFVTKNYKAVFFIWKFWRQNISYVKRTRKRWWNWLKEGTLRPACCYYTTKTEINTHYLTLSFTHTHFRTHTHSLTVTHALNIAPGLPPFFSIVWGQFHQHPTSSFCVCLFPKRKKDCKVISLFCALGICACKSCSKNIDEIEP